MQVIENKRHSDDDFAQLGPGRLSVNMTMIQTEYVKRTKDGTAKFDYLHNAVSGMRKYLKISERQKTYNSGALHCSIGNSNLLKYAKGHKKSKKALFVVPSLINKHNILDLSEEQSFCKAAADYGYDCYLLDWGDLCAENPEVDLDELIQTKLCVFLREIAQEHQSVFALGYCLGGTILAYSLESIKSFIEAMILIASPFDFAAGDSALRLRIASTRGNVEQLMLQYGCLPNAYVQGLFAAMNIDRSIQKFSNFLNYDDDSVQQKKFVAVEKWLSEGEDLPHNVARHCLDDWYQDNKLMMMSSAEKEHNLPTLIVASPQDKIVPLQSSIAYGEKCTISKILEVDKGHVGMMAGDGAQQKVWSPIFDWMGHHSEV